MWVDPPLGWPWWKHGCFDGDKEKPRITRATALAGEYEHLTKSNKNLILGVVVEAAVPVFDERTIIYLEIGDEHVLRLTIKGRLGSFLVGRLAIFDPKNKRIAAFDNEHHAFSVLKWRKLKGRASREK